MYSHSLTVRDRELIQTVSHFLTKHICYYVPFTAVTFLLGATTFWLLILDLSGSLCHYAWYDVIGLHAILASIDSIITETLEPVPVGIVWPLGSIWYLTSQVVWQ